MHGGQGDLVIAECVLEPEPAAISTIVEEAEEAEEAEVEDEDQVDAEFQQPAKSSTTTAAFWSPQVPLRKQWRVAVSHQRVPHAPTLQFSIALSGVVVVRRMEHSHQQRALDLELERSCYGQLTQAQAVVQVASDRHALMDLVQVRKCDSSSDSNVVDLAFDATSASAPTGSDEIHGHLFTEILLSSNVQLTGLSVLGNAQVVISEDVFTTLTAPVGVLKLAAVGDAKLLLALPSNDNDTTKHSQRRSAFATAPTAAAAAIAPKATRPYALTISTSADVTTSPPPPPQHYEQGELRLNSLEVSSSGNGLVQLDVAMLSVVTHVALNSQGNGRIHLHCAQFFRCYGVLNTALESFGTVRIEASSVIVDEIQVGGAGNASLCMRAREKSHCNRLSVGIAGQVNVDLGLIVCETASLGLAGSPKLLVQVSDRLCVGAVAMDDQGDGFVRCFCGIREPRVIEEAPRGVVSVWQWDRFLTVNTLEPVPLLAPQRVQVSLPGNSLFWRLQDAWEFVKANFMVASSP